MRFHLEGQIKLLIKSHNAGIVYKGGAHPWLIHFLCGGTNVGV